MDAFKLRAGPHSSPTSTPNGEIISDVVSQRLARSPSAQNATLYACTRGMPELRGILHQSDVRNASSRAMIKRAELCRRGIETIKVKDQHALQGADADELQARYTVILSSGTQRTVRIVHAASTNQR
jgi:hypothetical protein